MPTYEYVCEHCSHEMEVFQSITEAPLVKCPKCQRKRLRRLIGAGGGIIFRCSGFYATDYRSASYKEKAKKEERPETAESSKGTAAKKGEPAD